MSNQFLSGTDNEMQRGIYTVHEDIDVSLSPSFKMAINDNIREGKVEFIPAPAVKASD